MEHFINHANRKFYEIPSETAEGQGVEERTNLTDHKGLLSLVCQSVIGKDKTFSGPFGLRKGWYFFFVIGSVN